MKIKMRHVLLIVVFLLAVPGILFALDTFTANKPGTTQGVKSTIVVKPTIIKYTPHMTVSSLAGRSGDDLVALPNGRCVKVATIRNFHAAAKIMKAPRVDRTPLGLKALPDKKVFKPISTAYDLSAAFKLPNNTTIKLPSGRYATVGQIKFLQPIIDKRTGNKLTALSQWSNPQGPAIKIPRDMTKTMTKGQQQVFWENILQQKDNTILESPNGIRITVGDLRKGLAKNIKTMPRPFPERRPQ